MKYTFFPQTLLI